MSDYEKHLNKTAHQLIHKANQRQNRSQKLPEYNAAILSIYGLQIAIPVVIAIIVGGLLDHQYPHPKFLWTLNLIIVGFIVGFINATLWVQKSTNNKGKTK